ncbi:MAG: hypothetical protein PUG15_09090 [Bacteroidales bacterium]|nr:hypothetical protein [Bacteroidales bacterium]
MNILYYGIFKILCKGTRIIDFTMVWYYKLPFVKKRLAKFGYTPKTAKEFLNAMWNSPEDGWNTHYAMWWLGFSMFLWFFDVYVIICETLGKKADTAIPWIITITIIFLIMYMFLFKKTTKGKMCKEKYLFYFEEFERKPHKTKVLYGVLSVMMFVLPLVVLTIVL